MLKTCLKMVFDEFQVKSLEKVMAVILQFAI